MVALLWFIHGGSSLAKLLNLTLISGSVNFALGLLFLWLRRARWQGQAKKQVSYRRLLAYSWPLFINNLAMFVMGQADIWILAALASEQEVAIYGTAVRLVLLTGMTLMIVNAVVPPLIAQLNVSNEKEKLQQLLSMTSTLAALPALVILGIFVFAGGPILAGLYGDFYQAGWAVLAIRSIGQAASVWAGSCGYTLIMTGHQKEVMKISLWAAVLSLSLAILFANVWGKDGLAIAVSVAIIVKQIWMVLAARRLSGVWTQFSLNYLLKSLIYLPKQLRSIG
jgi:O-antigen/teichoic acid export membrane protein